MTSKKQVYVALFLGQGGYFFSLGMLLLASRIRATGAECDVYYYTEHEHAATIVRLRRGAGCRVALVGYSLGVSTVTYMQSPQGDNLPVDLLVALAPSTLAQNYRVDKGNSRLSVLWHGWDFLSSAGLDLGFDRVHETSHNHLLIDWSPEIHANVVANVEALQ